MVNGKQLSVTIINNHISTRDENNTLRGQTLKT